MTSPTMSGALAEEAAEFVHWLREHQPVTQDLRDTFRGDRMDEAADMVERQSAEIAAKDAEIARLRHASATIASDDMNTIAQMGLELEALRAEIERLKAGGCARDQTTTQYCAEAVGLAAEVERLRALTTWRPIDDEAKRADEIWAYSEHGGTGTMLVRWIAMVDFLTDSEVEEFIRQGASADMLETPDWFHADFLQGDRLSPDCYPTHYMLPLAPGAPPPSVEET